MRSAAPRWLAGALLAVASASPIATPPTPLVAPPPTAEANDNRRAAGTMRGDTLFVNLDVRMARWYPEAPTGAFVEAPMLGEVGRAPQVPGPLIRVREGTLIVARVTNALTDSTVTVRGLTTKPGLDSVKVHPGRRSRCASWPARPARTCTGPPPAPWTGGNVNGNS